MNNELRDEILEDLGLSYCPIVNDYVGCQDECENCEENKKFEEFYNKHFSEPDNNILKSGE